VIAVAVIALSAAAIGLGNGGRHPKAALPRRSAARPRPAGPVPTLTQDALTRTSATTTTKRTVRHPNLARLVGQLIVARFSGTQPSPRFLTRVHAGEVGGVILFADNTAGGLDATRRIVDELQRAARTGGNPPLLVLTDQEGGTVRRLSGPPALAASQMSSTAIAQSEGKAAGELLRSVGINVDLAPVADVERTPTSFLGSRSFGSIPAAVAARACAFATGLASTGIAYTLKHFPGLGRAVASTDNSPVSIPAPREALRSDYAAYESCGARPQALIMISSASYPSLAGPSPAVLSPAIYHRELPIAIGATGPLTISDDLQASALASVASPALGAVNAGLDLVLYARTEDGSASAYVRLLDDARTGAFPLRRLREAVARIDQLKHTLPR
jgi:beta-N-acetylhexosaminidase